MLLVSLLLLAAAPPPLRVAVPNFGLVNVSTETAAFFMDRFANRLRGRGLVVTTASEIETVLGLERQKALLGCAEESTCQAEIAAALGADAVVKGRIARFGERFETSVTLIDPTNAGVIASVSASAGDEGGVLTSLDAAADELSSKLLAARHRGAAIEPTSMIAAGDSSRPKWIALVPLALGVGAGVAGGIELAASFQKVQLIATTDMPEQLAAQARLDRGLGIALVGVGVVGLTTAAILFFTGKAPVATPVALHGHDGAWVGLEGRLP